MSLKSNQILADRIYHFPKHPSKPSTYLFIHIKKVVAKIKEPYIKTEIFTKVPIYLRMIFRLQILYRFLIIDFKLDLHPYY